MLATIGFVSLALANIVCPALAIDVDPNNQDSIKSAAKILASNIMETYNASRKNSLGPDMENVDLGWYEAGSFFEGFLEYSHLVGDSQYNGIVHDAMQQQVSTGINLSPYNQSDEIFNADQCKWGLAALTASEIGFTKPENGNWLSYAENAFDSQAMHWQREEQNKSCGGGLRMSDFSSSSPMEYELKDAGSNGNFFLLAARLAHVTGNDSYTQWAEKSYEWATNVGLVSPNFTVIMAANATLNCAKVNTNRWTSDFGAYTEGAAMMYNVTKGAQKWQDIVKGFVRATWDLQMNGDNILHEPNCGDDPQCIQAPELSKAQASLAFARAAIYAPVLASSLDTMLKASAKSAASLCDQKNGNISCTYEWDKSVLSKSNMKDGSMGETYSVMNAVQSLLYPDAKSMSTATASNNKATSSGKHNGATTSVAVSMTVVISALVAAVLSL